MDGVTEGQRESPRGQAPPAAEGRWPPWAPGGLQTSALLLRRIRHLNARHLDGNGHEGAPVSNRVGGRDPESGVREVREQRRKPPAGGQDGERG